MENFLIKINELANSFKTDEEGAQVIEYALIIAVVSIVLVVALKAITGDDFVNMIGRIGTCLTTTSCL